MRWLRLYAETIDDAKLKLLAFEDRWHFIALLCMKADGILDKPTEPEMLARMVAVKLGLTVRDAEEVKRRLAEVALISDNWQPTSWTKRQFLSDHDPTHNNRQSRYRERQRSTLRMSDASRDARVTDMSHLPDTDTDPERKSVINFKAIGAEPRADSRSTPAASGGTPENVPRKHVIDLPLNTGQTWAVSRELLDEWISLYPGTDVLQELRKMRAWCDAKPANCKTGRGVKTFVVNWLNRAHDSRRDTQHGVFRPLSAVDRVRQANDRRLAELGEAPIDA